MKEFIGLLTSQLCLHFFLRLSAIKGRKPSARSLRLSLIVNNQIIKKISSNPFGDIKWKFTMTSKSIFYIKAQFFSFLVIKVSLGFGWISVSGNLEVHNWRTVCSLYYILLSILLEHFGASITSLIYSTLFPRIFSLLTFLRGTLFMVIPVWNWHFLIELLNIIQLKYQTP